MKAELASLLWLLTKHTMPSKALPVIKRMLLTGLLHMAGRISLWGSILVSLWGGPVKIGEYFQMKMFQKQEKGRRGRVESGRAFFYSLLFSTGFDIDWHLLVEISEQAPVPTEPFGPSPRIPFSQGPLPLCNFISFVKITAST